MKVPHYKIENIPTERVSHWNPEVAFHGVMYDPDRRALHATDGVIWVTVPVEFGPLDSDKPAVIDAYSIRYARAEHGSLRVLDGETVVVVEGRDAASFAHLTGRDHQIIRKMLVPDGISGLEDAEPWVGLNVDYLVDAAKVVNTNELVLCRHPDDDAEQPILVLPIYEGTRNPMVILMPYKLPKHFQEGI